MPACFQVHCVHVWGPQKPEVSVESPGTEVKYTEHFLQLTKPHLNVYIL